MIGSWLMIQVLIIAEDPFLRWRVNGLDRCLRPSNSIASIESSIGSVRTLASLDQQRPYGNQMQTSDVIDYTDSALEAGGCWFDSSWAHQRVYFPCAGCFALLVLLVLP